MAEPSLQSCDLLFQGADVIDGTGAPARRADVAVVGERIAAIGDLSSVDAKETVDARGRVVAPGFIDVHTHDDRAVLSAPDMTPKISQGVTTVIAGNCGVSLAPLVLDRPPPPPLNLIGDSSWFRFPSVRAYRQEVEADPAAVNVALLVGHSSLRVQVMDDLTRPASPTEIDEMADLVDEAMESGCLGLSTGLAYPPAIAAPTQEVIALAGRVARLGGLYATHMRNERGGVVASVEETLDIGRRAEVAVVISHHKCAGRANWGLTKRTLAIIEAARRHQTVNLDVYPYTASSTVLMADAVRDSERVLVTWSEPHPDAAGRDLGEIADEWECTLEAAVERLSPGGAIYFQMDEADLRRVLSHPDTMVGSDGLPHDARPHPRLWGTFPRVLGYYCRDVGLLGLEEAVHRMTGIPASVFGIEGRGRVAPGFAADLVLFDPETVIDEASYEAPARPATGIQRVLVNGGTVWSDGAWSGDRPGRFLARTH